jgi:threonylcarbamoyladenosine tRNA methylthiotransferase MtaB
MTFTLYTLGCKVNQCDGENLTLALQKAGYTEINKKSAQADIYIINTCTVTHTADKKAMQQLRRARAANPQGFVAVCGCMARMVDGTAPKIPGADLVFDTRQPSVLLDALAAWGASKHTPPQPAPESPPHRRTRAFLKVQDGCESFCAYCIVPYVRGKLTSLPIDEVISQANRLVQSGHKEIVLTGIQLAAYGKDLTTGNCAQLVAQMGTVKGLCRLRLSSLEPNIIDDEFVAALLRTPAVCDHFHLSLQSGCDKTLARMNRGYTTSQYAAAAQKLRTTFPQCAITTDIITGFPAEDDKDHEQSLEFVGQMAFARIHVFPYSRRDGTAAAAFEHQLPPEVKKARMRQMLRLDVQDKFFAKQKKQTHEVLFETPFSGHTRNYCPVRVDKAQNVNTIKNVYIIGYEAECLIGECI